MLGPLKFGLQKPALAAAAPGRFELTLSLEGLRVIDVITLKGPPGATATFTWIQPNGGSDSPYNYTIPSSGIFTQENAGQAANTYRFTGSNLITEMYIRTNDSSNMTGITGTYPTALKLLQLGFNYVNPTFTPPNVETLLFAGKPGPSSLTTGPNLTRLDFPPNLTTLNLRDSTKLTTLPALPAGLTILETPPGLTVLPGLPSTLTTLNLRDSTKLTTLPALPAGLTILETPPGLTVLPGLPSTLTYLDTTASTKLTTINLSGCTGISTLNFNPFGSLQTLDISNCRLLRDISTIYSKNSDPTTYRITAPNLTNLRIDGSGLTYLDLTGTNVSTLNIPPEMYAQLQYLKLSGSKVKVPGLLKYQIPSGAKWILY